MILFFKNEYDWLSNFYPVVIDINNIKYSSVEHAYQSKKSDDMIWKLYCASNISASDIKKESKKIKILTNWDNIRLIKMYECLIQKFNQEPFKTKLLNTGNANIQEGNTWGDEFWGINVNKNPNYGENHLGRLIMKIREDFYK